MEKDELFSDDVDYSYLFEKHQQELVVNPIGAYRSKLPHLHYWNAH